jgi:hypothetical protein
MRNLFFIFLIAIIIPSISVAKVSSNKKITVGWLERIFIPSIDSTLRAKLDTGAKTSSIDAEIIDIKNSKVEDDKYGKIIFTVEDMEGKKKTLKRKIVRWAKIKKKGSTSGYIRRPVVLMQYCVAGKLITEEVNLSNREHFNYPVLIGRNMLTEAGLVIDTSQTYTKKPDCEKDTLKDIEPEDKQEDNTTKPE